MNYDQAMEHPWIRYVGKPFSLAVQVFSSTIEASWHCKGQYKVHMPKL